MRGLGLSERRGGGGRGRVSRVHSFQLCHGVPRLGRTHLELASRATTNTMWSWSSCRSEMSSWDRVGRANPLGQPINPTGVGGVGTMNGADQRPRHTNGTRPGTSNHRYRRRARSRRVSPCFRPAPSDWIVCQKKNGGLEQSANGRQQIRQRMADPKATDRRESEGDVMSDSGAWVETRQWLDPRFSSVASTLHAARPPHWPDRHRQGSVCREGPTRLLSVLGHWQG